MRLLVAIALTAAAVVAAPVASDQQTAASCVAARAKFKPARVARGGVVTITGQNFGDDCPDTGTLPADVGPLGTPLTGLAIVVDQGSNEIVLATGSADSAYGFRVAVVIPAELEPGEAILNVLGAGDARLTIDPPLVISGASPIDSARPAVATFGPPTTLEPDPVGTDPLSVLPADIPDEPAATAPPLSAASVDADDGNDDIDLQRAISVGVAGVIAVGVTGFAVWSRSRRRR